MRVKTSISLPEEQLEALARLAGKRSNRSRLIEQAVDAFLKERAAAVRYARELETMRRSASRVNKEMADVLKDQVPLWED